MSKFNEPNYQALSRYFPAFAVINDPAAKYVPLFPDSTVAEVDAWRKLGRGHTRIVDGVRVLKPFEKPVEPFDKFFRDRTYQQRLMIGVDYDIDNSGSKFPEQAMNVKGEEFETDKDSGLSVTVRQIILNAYNNFPIQTPGTVWLQHQVYYYTEKGLRTDYTFLLWLPLGDKPPSLGDVCIPNYAGLGDEGRTWNWIRLIDTPTVEIQDKLDEERRKRDNEEQLVRNGAQMNELLGKIETKPGVDPALAQVLGQMAEVMKQQGELISSLRQPVEAEKSGKKG